MANACVSHTYINATKKKSLTIWFALYLQESSKSQTNSSMQLKINQTKVKKQVCCFDLFCPLLEKDVFIENLYIALYFYSVLFKPCLF